MKLMVNQIMGLAICAVIGSVVVYFSVCLSSNQSSHKLVNLSLISFSSLKKLFSIIIVAIHPNPK